MLVPSLDILRTEVMMASLYLRPTDFQEVGFSVPLVNPTETAVNLPAGLLLAEAYEIDKQDSSDSTNTVSSTEERREDDKTPPTPKQLQIVLDKLGIRKDQFSDSEYRLILDMVTEVFSAFPEDSSKPGFSTLPAMDITTTGAPIRSKAYRYSPRDMKFLQETLNRLLDSGVITPSNSPWSFPVMIARHRTGKLRMCVDYKKLNAQTVKDAYPLPDIETIIKSMGGKLFYSTVDLAQGYHQVLLSDVPDENGFSARDKSSMVTPFGTYAWNAVGFGMSNAPPHFMRCMDVVLSGLHWSQACVFVDDIVIFSSTFEEHIKDLTIVFQRLIDVNLKVKTEKCQLFLDEIQFLGFTFSKDGIEPIRSRCEAIAKMPKPRTLTELRSFIGICQYYRRFVESFSILAGDLSDLTKKINLPFKVWDDDSKAHKAFTALKDGLCSAPILKLPDFTKPWFIYTDASKVGFGAILEQDFTDEDGVVRRHPVHYASRKTSAREATLESTHREASAVVWALDYFRYYCQGLPTTVFTDHGPLTWIMGTDFKNTPLAKYALRLQEWQSNVKIVYKPGRLHQNADGPSRLPVNMKGDVVDTDDIIVPEDKYVGASTTSTHEALLGLHHATETPAWERSFRDTVTSTDFLGRVRKHQREEPSTRKLIDYLRGVGDDDTHSILEAQHLTDACRKLFIEDGLLYRHTLLRRHAKAPEEQVRQLYIPAACRRTILIALHDHPTAGHVGKTKMLDQVRFRFYWPKYLEEVSSWVLTCPLCQRFKGLRRRRVGLLHPKEYMGPMHTLSIDFVSGFPTFGRFKYVMTIVDTFTRWTWLVPMHTKEDNAVASAIYREVVMIHGCVRRILSDQGTEFENKVLRRLCERMGIKKSRSSAAHPQTNAQAERIHRHVPKTLAILARKKKDWPLFLAEIQFAYNTTPLAGLGYSPYEMLYLRSPVLPVDVLTSSDVALATDRHEYGLHMTSRAKEMWELVRTISTENSQKAKDRYDVGRVDSTFEAGSRVLLYRYPVGDGPLKLEAVWHGPFIVTGFQGTSTRTYKLENPDTGDTFPADVTDLLPYRTVREPAYVEEAADKADELANRHRQSSNLEYDSDATESEDGRSAQPEQVGAEPRPAPPMQQKSLLPGHRKTRRLPIDESKVMHFPSKTRGVLENLSQHFLDMDRATQVSILEARVLEINGSDALVRVAKSTISGIDRRYQLGVFAKQDIGEGRQVAVYEGEELTPEQVEARYPQDNARYLLQDPEWEHAIDCVDPSLSSVGRFFNCCGPDELPNVQLVYSAPKDGVFFVTLRDVEKGEELVWDYGDNYDWNTVIRGSTKKGRSKTTRVPRVLSEASSSRPLADSRAAIDVAELQEHSMILYNDLNNDVPLGESSATWALARVTAVDTQRRVIEAHLYGSYQYIKKPAEVRTCAWYPRNLDPKDGKVVFRERSDSSRYMPVLVHVHAADILDFDFYLTNHGRIPLRSLRHVGLALG